MLAEGIVAFVNAQPGIAAVIAGRIQPPPAPEFDPALYPLITYQISSDSSDLANDGPVGVAETRVIFDCLAERYLDARRLALALKTLFHGYAGTLPDGTEVQLAKSASLADRFDDGSRIYCTTFQALITYGD
jgi:hypothetical protein